MAKTISKSALSFILITTLLNMMGIGIIIPVLPFILQQYVPPAAIALNYGLLTSIYSLCQFIAAPALGLLSDRYGRRPILLFSLFGSVIGYILLGVGGSLSVLFFGRIVDGLTGGNISTIFAYVADLTDPQDRGKYYGYIGAAAGFGFVIGPVLGGFIARLGLSAPLYLAAGVLALNTVWGYFALPESLAKKDRLTSFVWHHLNPLTALIKVLGHELVRMLLLVTFFFFFAFAELQGNASVLTKDVFNWTPTDIGILFFIIGIVDIIVQGFLIRLLIPKLGEAKIAVIGLFIAIFGFVVMALLPVLHIAWLPYLGAIIFATGDGLFEPSMGGLLSATASPQEQGRVQGANQSVQAMTRVIGPLLAAWLYGIGWSLPYIVATVVSSVGLILLIQIFASGLHKKYAHEVGAV